MFAALKVNEFSTCGYMSLFVGKVLSRPNDRRQDASRPNDTLPSEPDKQCFVNRKIKFFFRPKRFEAPNLMRPKNTCCITRLNNSSQQKDTVHDIFENLVPVFGVFSFKNALVNFKAKPSFSRVKIP